MFVVQTARKKYNLTFFDHFPWTNLITRFDDLPLIAFVSVPLHPPTYSPEPHVSFLAPLASPPPSPSTTPAPRQMQYDVTWPLMAPIMQAPSCWRSLRAQLVVSSAAGMEATAGEPPLIPATIPDRRNHVTSGHAAPDSAATIGVSVAAHRHDPNVNNAPRDERAPEPPPRRHRDGGGVPATTQQLMHNGSPATSESTSGPTCNGTATHQAGQVMFFIPNAAGNALATVLEEA